MRSHGVVWAALDFALSPIEEMFSLVDFWPLTVEMCGDNPLLISGTTPKY
jgi:hypothetical protein